MLLNFLINKFRAALVLGFSAVGASSIAIPSVLVGNKYEQHLFREFNPEIINKSDVAQVSEGTQPSDSTKDTSQFSNFPEVKFSNSQLIKGTKLYNQGNYLIYFGSEACPNCNNFLYSDSESPKSWRGSHENIYRNGILYETYSLVKASNKLKDKNIKFIFFSDEIPSMEHRNNDDLARIPWTKWNETLVSQGKIQGDFVRYDKSAVDFRKLQSLLMYYFGEKSAGIPTIIIYKDGIPFVFGKDKIEELEKDKKNAGSHVSAQDATISTVLEDVAFRFDLFKHIKYIYSGDLFFSGN